MGTFYKYAERGTDAYVDWNVIGKTLSDNLLTEKKYREEKKAKIDEDSRNLGNELSNIKQGEFQDANKFVLEYAANAQEARLMQDKLLKSGRLNVKDYTVMRQNLGDGTKQITELQSLYQNNYKSIMEGINSGELQALNTANMASVEGFADFSKSQAYINPNDGTVSVASKKFNENTGLWEITKNVVPVSVLKGKILTKIAAFKTDESLNAYKKSLGVQTEAIYTAATMSGAGTIVSLTGPGAIEKYPKYKGVIESFNESIDDKIGSWLSNPYNITSVLTQDTGNYSAESFTYDKDEASKDPSKILLKINPSTQLPTIDPNGLNYEAQKKEAAEYLKNQLIIKIDSEKKIQTTAQIQERRAPTEFEYSRGQGIEKSKEVANLIGNLWYGDNTQIQKATSYFRDLDLNIMSVDRNSTGVSVTFKDGTVRQVPFKDANGKIMSQQDFIVAAGPLLAGQIDVKTAVDNGAYNPNGVFNATGQYKSIVKAAAKAEPIETTYAKFVDSSITASDIKGKSKSDAISALKSKITRLGLTINSAIAGGRVSVENGNGDESPTVDITTSPEAAIKVLKDWIKLNPTGKDEAEKKANLGRLKKSGVFGSTAGELD